MSTMHRSTLARAATITGLALALLAPAAQASDLTHEPWAVAAERAAAAHWNAWPAACGQISVYPEARPEWNDALGHVGQIGATTPDQCVVWVAASFLPMVMPYDWQAACALMTHEIGHLLGYRHPEDPEPGLHTSDPVMREDLQFASVPECNGKAPASVLPKAKPRKARARKATR